MDFILDKNTEINSDNSRKPIRSWSQFSLYMRCPELYRARYVDKELPRASSMNMHIGNCVHHAHEVMSEAKRSSG